MVHNEFKAITAYLCPNGHYMPMTLEDISDESEYAIDDRKYYSQSYRILIKAYIIQESDFEVTRVPSRAIVRLLGTSEKHAPKIQIEEEDYNPKQECIKKGEEKYYHKKVSIIVNLDECVKKAEFDIDMDVVIEEVELDNVYDFFLGINLEEVNFDNEVQLYDGDTITLIIEREDNQLPSTFILKGYDPNETIHIDYTPESSLDDPIDNEEIIINA